MRSALSFDHFELLETLGTGGMGTVYRARDTQLDRDVALKVLRKDLGPEYVNELQHEARVTASVNHPNVVQVFSFGRAHEQYYLVMELVDRGTLDDLIQEKGKIPEEKVLRAGIEVARGLRAAFHKGLIHRDVKPANILFNNEGTAKISDFGLAGLAEPHGQTAGAIWGTPYYVAPERLNNAPEDFRSDIYSLGATLFHAAAGRPPFEGETASAGELRALKDRPLKLNVVAPEISPGTATAINRMIAPDPRLRYHSYEGVIAALEKARGRLLGEIRPSRAKPVLVGGALLLAAVAIGGWLISHRSHHPAALPQPVQKKSANAPAIDLDRNFADARRQLVQGKYTEARAAFARLAADAQNKQPLYDWAKLNQALAALLDHEPSQMQQALQAIENAGTRGFKDPQLGALLLETARRANTRTSITVADLPEHGGQAFSLFFAGLVDIDLERFDSAIDLLEKYLHRQPKNDFAWMAEYKPLAQQFLNDSCAWLSWRERRSDAKTPAQLNTALSDLRSLLPKLRSATIAREASLEEKTLAARVSDAQSLEQTQREEQQRALLAREMPQWNAGLEAFRRAAAVYDFESASKAVRTANVTEPSLKSTRDAYQRAADSLVLWKRDLITDLNAHGYNVALQVNNLQYSGIAGASATGLKLRNPYGFTEVDWLKIPPTTLLEASSAFASDADRKWRCAVFGWLIGQTSAANKLFDAACALKPSYGADRKFFEEPKH
ncbi:MAG: serine/threonine protein kinase [Verrucomicrobia bacterium]|nr:serine/threonine protein kinase [Verrucomicrobiota bacterium]